jgi:Mn2+/Fe2+ NRAMP family transporter
VALFGIGLLGASLLACAILPIATSYVISESLGFEKGVGHKPGDAPVFVGVITAMIAISTIVAVIPGIPVISLLVGVQVVNGLLLPINLFFIWQLARSRKIMGEHRNKGALDGLAAVTVLATSALSLILVVVTLLGK